MTVCLVEKSGDSASFIWSKKILKDRTDGLIFLIFYFLFKKDEELHCIFSSPEPLGSQGELIGWP